MNYCNSTFKIRPDAKRLQRTQMKRVPGTARLQKSTLNRSQKPMNKIGPRTKKWMKAWRFLKPEFDKRGRIGCEFGFIPHECWGPLDPAHSKKRGKMKGNDIYTIAMACRAIHNFLDYSCSHEEMELFVNRAIELAGGLILPDEKKAG